MRVCVFSVGDSVEKVTNLQGGWEYSQAALNLVAAYKEKFPRVFQVLSQMPNPPRGEYRRDLFGGEAGVDSIKAWLLSVRMRCVRGSCVAHAAHGRLAAFVHHDSCRPPRSPWFPFRHSTSRPAPWWRWRPRRRACCRCRPPRRR